MEKERREEILPVSGQYGPLKWTWHPIGIDNKGACLLGRLMALYDAVMETITLLAPTQDPEVRGITMAKLGKWVEYQNKRTKAMYSCICSDCPQVGKEAVKDASVTAEGVQYWYTLQREAMSGAVVMKKVLDKVWGMNLQGLLEDLQIPGYQMARILSWKAPIHKDMYSCLHAGVVALTADGEGLRLFTDEAWDWLDAPEKFEDTQAVRDMFISAWKSKEAELLALPPEKREVLWEDSVRS